MGPGRELREDLGEALWSWRHCGPGDPALYTQILPALIFHPAMPLSGPGRGPLQACLEGADMSPGDIPCRG